MKPVSTSYLDSGRMNQKQRTRDHLLAAARTLIEGGDTPRVEDVARESGISRTTAYRYFPTQTELLAAAFPETAATSMLPDPAPDDVGARVDAVVMAIIETVERTEPQQRAMLRLSLGTDDHDLPLRQGRAIGWLSEALERSAGRPVTRRSTGSRWPCAASAASRRASGSATSRAWIATRSASSSCGWPGL